jgi:hypothetical protein
MKLYAEKSKVSGLYWNEKKGTWTCYDNDPDVWHTMEELKQIQRFYSDVFQTSYDRHIEIIEKEVGGKSER